MAYSTELRVKALKDCVSGKTDVEVSAKHGMSKYTLNSWKKRLLDTGTLEKKKTERKSGKPYKYKPEKMKELLDKSKSSESAKVSKADKAQSSDGTKAQDTAWTSKKKKKSKKDKKKKKNL